ncbi:acyltransferase [Mucilaginibacter pedocola]|uniref:Acetyltransferase n=1 Tax=Mucilaginibacter pedocola TaxID=1792845 RepID=A0A1S9PII2_9SPHI|nr:acyltransferase [Mucilaginibacter pedocola]OOQ60763.1 acetyltransferase [Mucilaginibacter pedocola]
MSLLAVIKSHPRIKKFVHWLIVRSGHSRPRIWVRWFVNPFFHERSGKAIVGRYARMDLFPFNDFKLGEHSIVEDFAALNNGVGAILIGHHVGVGLSNTIIGPVTLGNYVMMAQNIVLSGLNHGFEDINTPPRIQKVVTKQITINDNVWLGANCVVTAGVTIGQHAVIGAGSVVTKDIPAYSVAVGNPAKVIKKYNFDTGTWEKV